MSQLTIFLMIWLPFFDDLVDNLFDQQDDDHYLVRRLSQKGSFFTQKQAEHDGSDAKSLSMKIMMAVVMVMVMAMAMAMAMVMVMVLLEITSQTSTTPSPSLT